MYFRNDTFTVACVRTGHKHNRINNQSVRTLTGDGVSRLGPIITNQITIISQTIPSALIRAIRGSNISIPNFPILQFPTHENCFLYSVGVMPLTSLNCRLKWLMF